MCWPVYIRISHILAQEAEWSRASTASLSCATNNCSGRTRRTSWELVVSLILQKGTDTGHTLRPWEGVGLLLEGCIIRTSLTWSAVHNWAGHTQSQSFPSSLSLSLSLPFYLSLSISLSSFLHGSGAHACADLLQLQQGLRLNHAGPCWGSRSKKICLRQK